MNTNNITILITCSVKYRCIIFGNSKNEGIYIHIRKYRRNVYNKIPEKDKQKLKKYGKSYREARKMTFFILLTTKKLFFVVNSMKIE